MSSIYFSQYDEAVPSENPDVSADEKEQSVNAESQNPLQTENFWCFIGMKIPFLRGLRPPGSESRNCFQRLFEVLTRSSVVQLFPSSSRAIATSSSAHVSHDSHVNVAMQKLNLNNVLMFVLCACIPVGSVPPPTKIMVCLPCPPTALPGAAGQSSANKNNEPYPFCVPRKLNECISQTPQKGKYLPPPPKRICSPKCLHVCDLKPVRPCNAVSGSPCVAHCFESHPKHP